MRRFLKSTIALIAGLALTLTVAISTGLPASAAAVCVTTFTKYGKVQIGSRGTQARAAQCLLRSAGYAVKPDGSFSAVDARKVKAFQRSVRLSQTGTVTSPTWTALLSRGSRPTLRMGDRGTAVKRLQRSLTASGRSVPVTGYFGPITKNAVRSLQRSQGWTASGTATAGVWRALQTGARAKVRVATAARRPAARSVAATAKGARALAFARKQIGDRYQYGATGPNAWDCSGLTKGSWKSVGVNLPRTSQAQFRSGGKRIAKSALRPGDLVFFYAGISHVAVYAGNGKVVHASNPRKPVNVLPMKYMPYKGAVRPG
ncbi:MAG TPA: peptidoglycan-binding protein [Propionibacteriaceae bacterium]|nr:peptidoglycan-binding protein [Propionibacteriaceae bacterium]